MREVTFSHRRRKHEGRMQAVTHYRTEVEDEGQTHTIHLMAHFSEDPAAIPLILNHGWPVSRARATTAEAPS